MQESTVHHLRLVTIKRQNQLTYLSHLWLMIPEQTTVEMRSNS